MDNLDGRVREAVRHFWLTRERQQKRQGKKTGRKDYGNRGAATGGKQIDGFIHLLRDVLAESGLAEDSIHIEKKMVALPGWFRATKEWDLVAVVDGTLLATVEFKSQVGAFGNNFNNRTEEAIGNGTDFMTAFEAGAFKPSSRPWLGYFMLLEDAPGSTKPVRITEPHFSAFPEFANTSYADRYRILCEKLVRARLYDAACLLLSERGAGKQGAYSEPSEEVGIRNFVESLTARALAFSRFRER